MVYLLSLLTAPLWVFPVLTANFAKRMGRPYKKWLVIGIVLPIVSTLLLVFLPDLSAKGKEAQEN